ncbi:MAG: hypothetical protein HYU05_01885 [Candidatus Wildermuthbacteria bacterium]|nr:hypothetical protein [Candidatus Wildermuthbacteria bacterium]
MKLRGPGDFAGTKQWGMPDFVMEQLANQALVSEAREAARALIEEDVTLANHPLIRERIEGMRNRLHLE